MTTTAPPATGALDDSVPHEPQGGAGDALRGPDDSGAPVENPFRALKRSTMRFLVIALVVTLVVAFFEIVVAGIWYHARQSQLASDFKVGRAHLAPGDAVGILQIPRLDVNVYVVEGDGVSQLRDGPGHRSSTPIPGKPGNSVIEGHAHGWGAPFKDLDQLHTGDLVVVQTRGKQPLAFKVTKVAHVSGDDDRLLGRTRDHHLTLVTGDGGLLSGNRLVISAVSGTAVGHPRASSVPPPAADESLLANRYVALAAVAILVGWLVFAYVRRRYRLTGQIAVVAPIAFAALLALVLELDLFLPKLR